MIFECLLRINDGSENLRTRNCGRIRIGAGVGVALRPVLVIPSPGQDFIVSHPSECSCPDWHSMDEVALGCNCGKQSYKSKLTPPFPSTRLVWRMPAQHHQLATALGVHKTANIPGVSHRGAARRVQKLPKLAKGKPCHCPHPVRFGLPGSDDCGSLWKPSNIPSKLKSTPRMPNMCRGYRGKAGSHRFNKNVLSRQPDWSSLAPSWLARTPERGRQGFFEENLGERSRHFETSPGAAISSLLLQLSALLASRISGSSGMRS